MERNRSDFEKMTVQELFSAIIEIHTDLQWGGHYGSQEFMSRRRRERDIAEEVFAEKMQAHGIPWNK